MNRRLTHCRAYGLALTLLALTLLVVGGCSDHRVPPMPTPQGKLAVAGITNPRFDWQLLAGYLPEGGRSVDQETLAELDQAMLLVLADHGVTNYVSPTGTRQCQEIVTFEQSSGKKKTALSYWLEVGQCMKVDYLVVPQILFWRDRGGDEWTVEEPASVVMDVYLIDVNDPTKIVRKHYDETQMALTEDLGNADKFIDRGGKWVTAKYLAVEGLDKMLLELGL